MRHFSQGFIQDFLGGEGELPFQTSKFPTPKKFWPGL